MNCSRCHAFCEPDSRFCSRCGLPLVAIPSKKPAFSRPFVPLLCLIGLIVLVQFVTVTTRREYSTDGVQVNNGTRPQVAVAPQKPKRFAELKSDAEKLLKIDQSDYEKVELGAFDAVLKPLTEIPAGSTDYKIARSLHKKLIEKVSMIGAERLVMGPKPIQIGSGGGVSEVREYLRAVLNDYDGSEFAEWYPVSMVYIGKEPYWGVGLRRRARNGFGALVLRYTYYYIRNNQVVKSKGLGVD